MVLRNEHTVDICKVQFRMKPGVDANFPLLALAAILKEHPDIDPQSVETKIIVDICQRPRR